MNRSTAWHQSTLELIGNCSWRYFLTYVLGIPDPSGLAAEIGTAVHSAVERHEKARIDGDVPTLQELQDEAARDLPEDSKEAARIAVRNWYQAETKEGPCHREWLARWTPVSIEEYFNFPLVDDAMPIGGTMDAIYVDEAGVYHVVDLKTAKDMGRWKSSGEGKRLQATMYSVAVQLRFNLDYLPDVTYAVVRTNKTGEVAKRVHIQPDLEDVRVLGQKIRDAQHVLNNEDYVKNPSWNLCRAEWCPHYQGCMVTGELSGTPATVRSRLSQEPALGQDSSIKMSQLTTTEGGNK
jgi:hypothetical protein